MYVPERQQIKFRGNKTQFQSSVNQLRKFLTGAQKLTDSQLSLYRTKSKTKK